MHHWACLFLKRCVIPLVVLLGTAHGQVSFYGVGDFPDGIYFSEVFDATEVGGVIYAVGGGSAVTNSQSADTAFLWTPTGGLTAIPSLAANPTATTYVVASAITPDGAYIAARSHVSVSNNTRGAVRVTTNGLTNFSLANLPGFTLYSAATAISDDGSILYGVGLNSSGTTQAVRFTVAGPTGAAIPYLSAGDDYSTIAGHGVSSDGSVAVGTSINLNVDGGDLFGLGCRAFRYVEGTGVAVIPYLPAGTWNEAMGLSPDGNLALVAGDTPTSPNGEAYFYDAMTGTTTSIGTPDGNGQFARHGGMNSDGSIVVVASYYPVPGAYISYVHNSHGWHDFRTLLVRAGVDLTGWSSLQTLGISLDGTLVYGLGGHNGGSEGFVVKFPAGFLAAATGPARSVADFDGDSKADVLWHNSTSGLVASWTSGGTFVSFGVEGSGWAVIGTGDFDGDGLMDVLWHNTSSGLVASWTSGGGFMTFGVEDGNWTVIGRGDYDGDGKTDVLWRSSSTGLFASWVSSGAYSTFGSEGNGWWVCGSGDFDGDDKADVLWLNTMTQWVASWPSGGGFSVYGIYDGEWAVIGTGDFDGDGKADVLWHNTLGLVASWPSGGGFATYGVEDSNWVAIGIGDYDGDGKADVLWRNPNTGLVASWTSGAGYTVFGVESDGWQVIP